MRSPLRHARPRLILVWIWLTVLLATPGAGRAEVPPDESPYLPGYRALKAGVGLGLAFADDQNGQTVEGSGQGFYGDVEYVLRPASWFSPRLYAGLIVALPRSDCGLQVQPCDVSAQFVFAGAKARVMIPIPWVAPFIELGLGGSLGHFSTRSGLMVAKQTNGLAYHVPFALGLALGARRQIEVAFTYLSHPSQAQVSGAVALGVQFSLDQ